MFHALRDDGRIDVDSFGEYVRLAVLLRLVQPVDAGSEIGGSLTVAALE